WLYAQLGGTQLEQAAIEFCESLKVEPLLVESAADFELALSAIEDDKRTHGHLVGLDIETKARPEYRQPGPAIRFTGAGITHEKQPKNRDRTGVDPYRSDIATLQIYSGGTFCYVFRNTALNMLLNRDGYANNAPPRTTRPSNCPFCTWPQPAACVRTPT